MKTNSEFQSLITLAGRKKNHTDRFGSDKLTGKTGQVSGQQELIISNDLRSRIEELQAISRSIDNKIVSHQMDDPAKYNID